MFYFSSLRWHPLLENIHHTYLALPAYLYVLIRNVKCAMTEIVCSVNYALLCLSCCSSPPWHVVYNLFVQRFQMLVSKTCFVLILSVQTYQYIYALLVLFFRPFQVVSLLSWNNAHILISFLALLAIVKTRDYHILFYIKNSLCINSKNVIHLYML